MSARSLTEQAEQLITEMMRRYNERYLERYDPTVNRGKQDQLHKSLAKVRLYIGANGSGKTTMALAEAVSWLLGYRPWDGSTEGIPTPPNDVLVVCKDFTHTAAEDVIPKLTEMIPASKIVKTDRLHNGRIHKWHLQNGSTLKLMTYEQDPTAFEGPTWGLAVLNEPPPYSIWSGISRGIAKADGAAIFALTPIGAQSAWIYDELYAKAGSNPEIFQVTADDFRQDSFMTERAKDEFEQHIDPAEREARLHGRFQHLVGLVYDIFDSGVHILQGDRMARVQEMVADPTIPKGLVVDPHDRKPFAMAWFLVTPQNDIIFFREWPPGEHHKMRSWDWAVEEYADYIRQAEEEMGITDHIAWRLIDPNSGPKRNVVTNESIADAFYRLGLYFTHNIDDRLQDGHLAVKQRLGYNKEKPISATNRPGLYITSDCPNLEYAMTHYSWKDFRGDSRLLKEVPGELAKDFADIVRYAAMFGPSYFNPKDLGGPEPLDLYRGSL